MGRATASNALLMLIGVASFFGTVPAFGQGPADARLSNFSGLAGLLRRPAVKVELNLTPDQEEAIRETPRIRGILDIRAMSDRMRDAVSDDERSAIGDEIRRDATQQRHEIDGQLRAILNSEQLARLDQIALREAGMSALADEHVSEALNFSTAQRRRVAEIENTYQERLRAARFQMSRSEREQLRADRDTALDKLLNRAQRKVWEAKLGAPLEAPVVIANSLSGERTTQDPQAIQSRPTPIRFEEAPPGATVIASFDLIEGNPTKQGAFEAKSKLMAFNFRDAPWDLVLLYFAEHAGLTLDQTVDIPGSFNHVGDSLYDVPQALDLLNGSLSQQGYLLLRRDKFLVAISTEQDVPLNLVPRVSMSDLPSCGHHELVSVVFSLRGIESEFVVNEVEQMIGPLGKVVSLNNSEQLLVVDNAGMMPRIESFLDKARRSRVDGTKCFRTFRLRSASVAKAEAIVRELFAMPSRSLTTAPHPSSSDMNPDADERIIVAKDARTNSLMVTASQPDLMIIDAALGALDADAHSPLKASSSGDTASPQFSSHLISSSDSRIAIEAIQRLVPTAMIHDDIDNKRLHVFATPSEQEQIRELITKIEGKAQAGVITLVVPLLRLDPVSASGTLRKMFKENEVPAIEPDVMNRRLTIRATAAQMEQICSFLKQMGEDSPTSALASVAADRTAQFSVHDHRTVETDRAVSPIAVLSSGDKLVIASDDNLALDRLQVIFGALIRSISKPPAWTVFYLQTADALETASMLSHLIQRDSTAPDSLSKSSEVGTQKASSNLEYGPEHDSSPPAAPFRIVPDLRSNALYVSGPAFLIREVEDILAVLDAPQSQDSRRDRVPRMVRVLHADVEDVAGVVRTVFAEYIASQSSDRRTGARNRGGDQEFDPMAFLMAVRQVGAQSTDTQGIRLTVGVDRRSNSLIISCDEDLFLQIRTVITNLDRNAMAANRTIRVVAVKPGSSTAIQETITSVSGKPPAVLRASSRNNPTPIRSGPRNQTSVREQSPLNLRTRSNAAGDIENLQGSVRRTAEDRNP